MKMKIKVKLNANLLRWKILSSNSQLITGAAMKNMLKCITANKCLIVPEQVRVIVRDNDGSSVLLLSCDSPGSMK